jgi:aminoglycoside/choline kinase family phosphotransferase/choline kinase
MKALILAAGYATRLRPHSNYLPKPLFPVAGAPVVDRLIVQLREAGCRQIVLNTHHLHTQIEAHIAGRDYGIEVSTRYEPTILGIAGAIQNLADFWEDEPFWVVNADIVVDIDFGAVCAFHLRQSPLATLVLTDNPQFNQVGVDSDGRIVSFDAPAEAKEPLSIKGPYTFTGIQIVDPQLLGLIPAQGFVHSIDVYRQALAKQYRLAAYIAPRITWKDIGTPHNYRQVALEGLVAQTTTSETSPAGCDTQTFATTALAGDGSDRRWFRLQRNDQTLILVDHGIRSHAGRREVDAFIDIGKHLHAKGVSVPRIEAYDRFSGLVLLQDLGDRHLQTAVKAAVESTDHRALYRQAVRLLVDMFTYGSADFDEDWTFQTRAYDRHVIIELECRYFVEAFLQTYLQMDMTYESLADEFRSLAQETLQSGLAGFMHRDFQSRNIMQKNQRLYIIDFQGARRGPIQYDLASLLIDPYVALPDRMQTEMVEYALHLLEERSTIAIDRFKFDLGYRCCRLTRNLQILGAYGFLNCVKGKAFFEQYIPQALSSLEANLETLPPLPLPKLTATIKQAVKQVAGRLAGRQLD